MKGDPGGSILLLWDPGFNLISNSQTAKTKPKEAQIVLFAEDVGEFEKGNLLTGTVDLSSQPSGTDMQWKVETLNNKTLNLHGVGLEWR